MMQCSILSDLCFILLSLMVMAYLRMSPKYCLLYRFTLACLSVKYFLTNTFRKRRKHVIKKLQCFILLPFLQFMRSAPLFVIPLLMPVNMDMLFFTYAIFFYFYGVYLHSGHELESLSAHNKYFNTSFQVDINYENPTMKHECLEKRDVDF